MHWVKNSKGQPYPVHNGKNIRPSDKHRWDNPLSEEQKLLINKKHHSSERKQFINDFNKMADDQKLKLLKDVSMNKDERDDFMKSEKTADELALNYLDGREVLADISTKLGYDYSV